MNDTANGWLLIIVFGGIFVAWLFSQSAKAKKNREKFAAQTSKLKDFTASVKRQAGTHWVAIDEKRGKLLISPVGSDSHRMFDAAKIISVEVHENGQSVLKSGRGKQAAKAAVSFMTASPLPLITGGPKAKPYTVEEVKRVELRIVVDGSVPTHDIRLLEVPAARDSSLYKAADENARFLHAKITALIKRAEEDKRQELHGVISDAGRPGADENAMPETRPTSVADELAKLASLRDSGILTEDEFAAQKARLLHS
ncbi:SHOCT domain-containing protein [Arthrobacter sp. GCM10027362]|uniref:SHOCT domain-containing protein n=1 Tax=Arthrobacter sp. GCM10027362 TaxID=3273379 RepID=UPI00362CCB34